MGDRAGAFIAVRVADHPRPIARSRRRPCEGCAADVWVPIHVEALAQALGIECSHCVAARLKDAGAGPRVGVLVEHWPAIVRLGSRVRELEAQR